ncbi:MAG: exopolysaccharide biosynthesis protein [Exiguobacterium profundum]|nr:MAG: exopolysaccharide biosynthesis protein [Exiguobacterium profundum]
MTRATDEDDITDADELLAEVEESETEEAPEAARRRRKPRKRLSDILTEIGTDTARTRISVADIMEATGARAIGALILLFAAPNVLPTPPGTSSILGMPLVYLTAQLMLGRLPWLPKFISERSIYRADFIGMMDRAAPILARAEKLLKPRFSLLISAPAERVVGTICFILAMILLLPIPLGNMPALAICLFAFGILEKDGLWIIAAGLVSAVALVIVSGVIWAGVKMAAFLVMNAF